MRKTSAALATLSLALVALTGCTATPAFNGAICDRMASTSGIDDAVTISGEFGEFPDVTVFAPVHADKIGFTDIITGEGRAVTAVQQPMTADIVLYSGETGEQIVSTEFDGNMSRISTIASWTAQFPGLADVLSCVTPGTRVLAALTPEGIAPDAQAGFGLQSDETVVVVVDVLQTLLPHAEGTPQFNDARGVPTVVRAADGTPGIIIPDSATPTEEIVQTLIKGEGDVVEMGSGAWLQYTAVGWNDKTVLTSTWGVQPSPISKLATDAPMVAEALVGQTVGSQVLVVVPGSGDTQAVVFVVDILGITPASGS